MYDAIGWVFKVVEIYDDLVTDKTTATGLKGITPEAGSTEAGLLPVYISDIGRLLAKGDSWIKSALRAHRKLRDPNRMAKHPDLLATLRRVDAGEQPIGLDLVLGGVETLSKLS